jgi:hypothetical protein
VWDDRGTAYTFSNQCNEDLIVVAASGGEPIPLPARATRTLEMRDQEPRQTFVVSRADGTAAVQLVSGTSQIAIEDDNCPSDH